MSFKRKLKRYNEKKRLKKEIKETLKDLGISMRYFKKTLPNLSGSGFEYYKVEDGAHKPSLKQKYSFLQDMKEMQTEFLGDIEEQKQKIKEGQVKTENIEEEVTEEHLAGNIRGFFNKE